MMTGDKPLYKGSSTRNMKGISDFATVNFYLQPITFKDVRKSASNQHLRCSNKSVYYTNGFRSTYYITRHAKSAMVNYTCIEIFHNISFLYLQV
jgi:hypothetical protein